MGFLTIRMLIMSLLLLLSGCGDMFQKQVQKVPLDSSGFNANCELNIDDFALILEEPIQGTIDCLGKNLKLFVKAVESNKPGYLSRVALENYIKKNRKDIKPEVLRALKSVFDINFLIYGDDPDYISDKNIDALVKFAKIFNEKASTNFKPIFMSNEPIDYENFKVQRDQRIKPAALIITSALKEIFNPERNGEVHKLDLLNLIDSFTAEENVNSMNKIKKMLFVKKIILGGEKFEINHLELASLVENFSSYVLLALDAVRYKDIRLDQESMVQFLNTDVEILNNLIFPQKMGDRSQEVLFSIQDAVDAFDILTHSDKFDITKYIDLIKEAKVIVMEGDDQKVLGADLKLFFNHSLNVLKTGTMFHRFWATERVLLESRPGRQITYDFKNLYNLFRSEKKRVDHFVRILKQYRFMRGENISAYYTDDYFRNPTAVYEIAMYEYALTLVMKRYGCPANNLEGQEACNAIGTLNGVYMTKNQVIALVKKFKKVLIENDLMYPGREQKIAETITLLGSLFQYQSDENKVFDVNEATEFAISLFTSIDISKDINDYLTKLVDEKKCEADEFGRFNPSCVRGHFFEGLCLSYPDQFPKLFDSLGATIYESESGNPKAKKLVCKIPNNQANEDYLITTSKTARTCHLYPNTTEEIFYSKGDLQAIIMAMMHIETTILRWDVRNRNNIMDADEVMDAYNIYSPALDGLLENQPGIIKKLKKQIYQFLIKYEQVPDQKNFSSIWKFAKFLVSFNKGAPAKRKTIASILLTIGEQGAASTFDCNLLRNPNDIPRDELAVLTPHEASAQQSFFMSRPLILTQGDMAIAQDVEAQSDSWLKLFLSSIGLNF